MLRSVVICLLLTAAAVSVYGQTIGFDFVNYDDPTFVTENRRVRSGLTAENIKWAFAGSEDYWRPVSVLSHMLDCQLYGAKKAGGHHLTSVILHVLNTLVLFGMLRTMTGAVWRSAIVAALFALHPLHVESVAWIAERKGVLSTFFGLLAIWSYACYAGRGGLWRYLLCAVCLALGLMAKPMLVTLPLLLLLLDFWPLGRVAGRRSWRGLVIEKIPLLALCVVSAIVTFFNQQSIGTVASMDKIGPHLRLANAVVSYVWYVIKTIWPGDLAILYQHPYLRGGDAWATWQIAGAAGLLLLITLGAIVARGKRYIAVGWLWYVITLLPVIGLVQVGEQARADRYTYVPLIGLFVAMTWGLSDLTGRFVSRRLIAVAVITVIAALAICAWVQAGHWRDSVTLFERSVSVRPATASAHVNLGEAWRLRGDTDKAIAHFRDAIEIDPQELVAFTGIGAVYYTQGRVDDAIEQYELALEIGRDNPGAQNKLANVHRNLAHLMGRQGDAVGAVEHLRELLHLEPDDPDAHNNLAVVLAAQGKTTEALRHYHKAIAIDPNNARLHFNLANLYARQNAIDEAIIAYRRALAIDPQFANAHYNLAKALQLQGRPREAERHFTIAKQSDAARPAPKP